MLLLHTRSLHPRPLPSQAPGLAGRGLFPRSCPACGPLNSSQAGPSPGSGAQNALVGKFVRLWELAEGTGREREVGFSRTPEQSLQGEQLASHPLYGRKTETQLAKVRGLSTPRTELGEGPSRARISKWHRVVSGSARGPLELGMAQDEHLTGAANGPGSHPESGQPSPST